MEKTFDQEIRNLQTEIQGFHLKIKTTPIPSEKDKLMKRREQLLTKLRPLLKQKEAQTEKHFSEKLEQFLQRSRHLISLRINGNILPIPKSLMIELRFLPCNHKKRIHIKELLRTYTFHENKRVPSTNQQLYDQWEMLFRLGYDQSHREPCRQCLAKRNNQKTKWGTYKDTPIGQISWELHKLR